MRRIIRWMFYCLVLGILLVVAGILLMDTVIKAVAENRIRAETGMDVKIGKFSVSLSSPTLLIEDFKLYNTAEFGGSPFIQMPELYIEYDRDQLRKRQLHIKLLRVNLAEVGIVTDKKGRSNIDALAALGKKQDKDKTQNIEFTGIDTLNLTFQNVRHTTLDTPPREEVVDFKLKNAIFHNLKKEEDFQSIAMVLAIKGGGSKLFQGITGKPATNPPAK